MSLALFALSVLGLFASLRAIYSPVLVSWRDQLATISTFFILHFVAHFVLSPGVGFGSFTSGAVAW